MNHRTVSIALALTIAVTNVSLAQSPEPLLWTFEDFPRIAKHEATMLGDPRRVDMNGRTVLCFNGTSDGVVLPVNPIVSWPQFTIEALIRPDKSGEPEQRFLHIEDDRARRLLLETRLDPARGWALDTFIYTSPDANRVLLDRDKLHPVDRWHWVALSFDGTTMAHHVNGTTELQGPVEFGPMTQGRMSLGVRLNQRSWYKGCIAEIRFTPRALRSSELTTEVPP